MAAILILASLVMTLAGRARACSRPVWAWLLPRVGLFYRTVWSTEGVDHLFGAGVDFSSPSCDEGGPPEFEGHGLGGLGLAVAMVAFSSSPALARGVGAGEAPWRGEPSLAEVRQVALSYGGLAAERWRNMTSRASNAAWLPDLSVKVSRGTGLDSSSSLQAGSDGTIRLGEDNDLTFEVRAQWELDRLVFDRAEVVVAGHLAGEIRRRQALLEHVTLTFFERRRAMARLGLQARGAEQAMELSLKVDEKTAMLDVLTGGWFSKALARGRKE